MRLYGKTPSLSDQMRSTHCSLHTSSQSEREIGSQDMQLLYSGPKQKSIQEESANHALKGPYRFLLSGSLNKTAGHHYK